MNKYLGKIILGSALSASSLAFAAESAPLALSEIQMDSVTAGTSVPCPPPRTTTVTRQTITQTQGDTYNASFSPTIGANLALINTGGQNVGAYTVQTGGTQYATNK
jgi:hypothetical protein